ncbi:MAG: hypothetical protein V4819_26050 [Verrucomicrobiota bacterium]
MKSALFLCVLANSAFAAVPILPPITSADLAKLQQNNPMTILQTPAKADSSVRRPENQSIIKQSVILHDGTNWTLVPKRAVVFLPEAMKSRVDVKPAGSLLSWSAFLAKNQAWLTTTDVSFEQATGKKPLQPERVAFWTKHDKVVIATHQRGPISVRDNTPAQSPTPTP